MIRMFMLSDNYIIRHTFYSSFSFRAMRSEATFIAFAISRTLSKGRASSSYFNMKKKDQTRPNTFSLLKIILSWCYKNALFHFKE